MMVVQLLALLPQKETLRLSNSLLLMAQTTVTVTHVETTLLMMLSVKTDNQLLTSSRVLTLPSPTEFDNLRSLIYFPKGL
jgi:hypothetical protein